MRWVCKDLAPELLKVTPKGALAPSGQSKSRHQVFVWLRAARRSHRQRTAEITSWTNGSVPARPTY